MIRGENLGGDTDYVLLGDNWFFSYYVIHDMENKKVGFYGPVEDDDRAFLASVSTILFVTLLFLFDS